MGFILKEIYFIIQAPIKSFQGLSSSLQVKRVIFTYEIPLLGMLHIVRKLLIKLESKDPPRPSQTYKHQVGLMEQQVGQRTCQVSLIGGSRKPIYRALNLIWIHITLTHKFDHEEKKKCKEEEERGGKK